jgi:hypothetical protein
MNDCGLFWDATGCAYLEMPYSEAHKQKYDGPLMQKVIEECASVQEALDIFNNYYCNDQYRGQYLLGDSSGASIIFEEFLSIDLNAELSKGNRAYDLPKLFSKIQIIFPMAGEAVNPSAVRFRWKGKPAGRYELYYSTDPNFLDCEPVPLAPSHSSDLNGNLLSVLLTGMVVMGGMGRKQKKSFFLIAVITILFYIFISCKENAAAPSPGSGVSEISITIENLEANTRYYWKVAAFPAGIGDFSTESLVQNFMTTH